MTKKSKLCLRLYTNKKSQKVIPKTNGLNLWNAKSAKENDMCILYAKQDQGHFPDFFPQINETFTVCLSDSSVISLKLCRLNKKLAITSEPNDVLGKWLLRHVFNIPIKAFITYDMLERFGIDSVIFTKNSTKNYSLDFTGLDTYEKFYNIDGESFDND